MKNRTDKILLVVFLLSLPVCAFIILNFLQVIDFNLGLGSAARGWLAVTLPAVPAFCLQLLLCRRTRWWIAALPGLAVIGTALWSTYGVFTAIGWDTLGYGILLLLCAAPAAGFVLAWAVYGFGKLHRKRGVRNAD